MDKALKKLQDTWYGKLKAEGFRDIEQDEDNLKIWDSSYFIQQYSYLNFASKQEYYQLAGVFLNEHSFTSKLEHSVWRLHTDGLSSTEITAALKKAKFKVYKNKVLKIIKDLKTQMLGPHRG